MAPPEYYRDAGKSRTELLKLLDGMVRANRITEAEAVPARADIEDAYESSDSATYFGTDAEVFWSDLAARIGANVARYGQWGGGVKNSTGLTTAGSYLATVTSGLSAYNAAKAVDYGNSWAAFMDQVVVQTMEDALAGAKGAADKVLNPWWLAAAAALVLGVIVLQGRR
jgi:hypothetical protein